MYRLRTLTLLSLGLLVFGATGAAAQDEGLAPGIYNPKDSTPVTMYFHVNGLQDVPVNTQKPDDRYAESVNVGLATHSQGCVDIPGVGLASGNYHTYYGFSSPGYVQYDVDEGGKPRYHPERGISFDVDLDTNTPVDFIWYMQGQATGGDTDGVPIHRASPPLPQVVMRTTIREGDEISPGHTAFNTGEIIAQGTSEPVNLMGASTTSETGQVTYVGDAENDAPVYKFQIPLEYQSNSIDKDESYNVRVDLYMENPLCTDPQADEYIMGDFLRLHTSAANRPQFTWNVMNPLRIEYLHPQFIGDDLVLHTSTNSPWGNYDVRGDQDTENQGGLNVNVAGPSVPVSLNRVALTARTHEHDHHTEAVDATWVWEYKKDGARDGLYTVTFTAKNDQETTEAIAVAQFEIGSGKIVGCGNQATGEKVDCEETLQKDGAKQKKESPGVGLLATVGILGAALVAMRRRS